MSPLIRILIADDHATFRENLSKLLELEDDLTIVGKAVDGLDVLEKAATLMPDIVIMDFDMPRKNGVEATQEIHRVHPAIVVIGYSMQEGHDIVESMLNAGAAGYVPKNSDRSELLVAIRRHAKRND
jgi:DNA-binding NarL/FixJ family response regulator